MSAVASGGGSAAFSIVVDSRWRGSGTFLTLEKCFDAFVRFGAGGGFRRSHHDRRWRCVLTLELRGAGVVPRGICGVHSACDHRPIGTSVISWSPLSSPRRSCRRACQRVPCARTEDGARAWWDLRRGCAALRWRRRGERRRGRAASPITATMRRSAPLDSSTVASPGSAREDRAAAAAGGDRAAALMLRPEEIYFSAVGTCRRLAHAWRWRSERRDADSRLKWITDPPSAGGEGFPREIVPLFGRIARPILEVL